MDDVVAWCLLALVVALSTAGSPMEAATPAGLAVAFALVILYVVKPLLARWSARADRTGDAAVLVALFSGLSLSALATDLIGSHALFGAFLFGVVTPRTGQRIRLRRPGCARSRCPCCCPSSCTRDCARTSEA